MPDVGTRRRYRTSVQSVGAGVFAYYDHIGQ